MFYHFVMIICSIAFCVSLFILDNLMIAMILLFLMNWFTQENNYTKLENKINAIGQLAMCSYNKLHEGEDESE